MLIIDPWLMELGCTGHEEALVAAMIGRAQFRTARRLGHLMNLGGIAERARITSHAHHGKLAREGIYCIRCGAGAHLDAWVHDDILAERGEHAPHICSLTERQALAIAFRLPCEGRHITQVVGNMLKKFLDEHGVKA